MFEQHCESFVRAGRQGATKATGIMGEWDQIQVLLEHELCKRRERNVQEEDPMNKITE